MKIGALYIGPLVKIQLQTPEKQLRIPSEFKIIFLEGHIILYSKGRNIISQHSHEIYLIFACHFLEAKSDCETWITLQLTVQVMGVIRRPYPVTVSMFYVPGSLWNWEYQLQYMN